jgi:hypothetical protein
MKIVFTASFLFNLSNPILPKKGKRNFNSVIIDNVISRII